jgi:hypothetical protein
MKAGYAPRCGASTRETTETIEGKRRTPETRFPGPAETVETRPDALRRATRRQIAVAAANQET